MKSWLLCGILLKSRNFCGPAFFHQPEEIMYFSKFNHLTISYIAHHEFQNDECWSYKRVFNALNKKGVNVGDR